MSIRNLSSNGSSIPICKIIKTSDRFISTPAAGVGSEAFEQHHFLGFKVFFSDLDLDNPIYPKNGVRLANQASLLESLTDSKPFINLTGNFAAYYTPERSNVTFTSRIGGATNFGSYQFFQSNTLGGTSNLRGFRRTRFYGRSSAYLNNENKIENSQGKSISIPCRIRLNWILRLWKSLAGQ